MKDKITIGLLLFIVALLIISEMKSCSSEGNLKRMYEKQNEKLQIAIDSIQARDARRVDSVKIHQNEIKYWIIEKKELQNEVNNTHNVDSLISLYYKHRANLSY